MCSFFPAGILAVFLVLSAAVSLQADDSAAAVTVPVARSVTATVQPLTSPVAPAVANPGVGSGNSIAEVKKRFTDDEWQEIVDGEVVSRTDIKKDAKNDDARSGEALITAIVNHPPEQLWKMMTDYAKYGEFLPKVEEMKVLGRKGNVARVYHQLGVLWMDIAYTLFMDEDKAMGRITWSMDTSLKHDIVDTTGFYEMVPYDGGKKTLMSYKTWAETGMAVPSFVENFLTRKTAPKILKNIRERADEVFGTAGN